MQGYGSLRPTEGPFAAYDCHKMRASNAEGIDSQRAEVTVIGEPGVNGAYIASTITEHDYGIDIRE